MPGLPLFGTVSAATAFVPTETETNMGSNLSATSKRVSEIMKYGFPGLDHVRSYEDFVLSYDRRNRVAHWVFEHLTRDRLQSNTEVSRSKCEFKPDPSIHPFFRSDNSDYKRSGYDRGHLAAAGNHKCHQRHLEQTFFLTNMAPQVGAGFNRDSWNRLEKYVRHLTKVYKDVYVCTGPLYLPKVESDGKKYVRYEVIGANHVAVPTHFYKIIVGETYDSKLEMEAFVMPNTPIDDNTPLTNFQVPPESVERAAGLLFFDKISRDKLHKINGKKC
nr:PREDICTED: endonuclease G, mitochondrial isoform X2 [Megachile rotundata]